MPDAFSAHITFKRTQEPKAQYILTKLNEEMMKGSLLVWRCVLVLQIPVWYFLLVSEKALMVAPSVKDSAAETRRAEEVSGMHLPLESAHYFTRSEYNVLYLTQRIEKVKALRDQETKEIVSAISQGIKPVKPTDDSPTKQQTHTKKAPGAKPASGIAILAIGGLDTAKNAQEKAQAADDMSQKIKRAKQQQLHTKEAPATKISKRQEKPVVAQKKKQPLMPKELSPVQSKPKTSEKKEAPNQSGKKVQTAKEEKQPNLWIHIGPSKTGTSTIQRESSYWQEQLAEDQYFYLGKFGDVKYRAPAKIGQLFHADDCFQEAAEAYKANLTKSFRETPCWQKKIQGLDRHRLRGDNIVLSDEAYSYAGMYDVPPDHYTMLKVALDGWNVTVVPTYRRYHEWYFSVLKERNRMHCLRGDIDAGKWPHEHGQACKPLWNPLQKIVHSKEGDKSGINYRNLDQSIPYWKDAGFPIQILNFHEPEHITCAFYCGIVPDAPHMCQHCRQQQGTNQNPSPAALTAYDDIVFEAAKRNLINKEMLQTQTRSETVKQLVKYHTKTLNRKGLADLPLICPPRDELQALLDKSLDFEARIMPELYKTPAGKREHRETFWKLALEERTFCWVDKEALLDGKETWEQVLEALRTTAKWPIDTARRQTKPPRKQKVGTTSTKRSLKEAR